MENARLIEKAIVLILEKFSLENDRRTVLLEKLIVFFFELILYLAFKCMTQNFFFNKRIICYRTYLNSSYMVILVIIQQYHANLRLIDSFFIAITHSFLKVAMTFFNSSETPLERFCVCVDFYLSYLFEVFSLLYIYVI